MEKWDNKNTDDLLGAILALESVDEAKRFFRDLLTERELLEFGARWRTAQLLNNGASYSKIEKETGLSSATIARIAKWLNSGKGGYLLALERLMRHHAYLEPHQREH